MTQTEASFSKNVWKAGLRTVALHLAILCVLCFLLINIIPHLMASLEETAGPETRVPRYAEVVIDITQHVQMHFIGYLLVAVGLVVNFAICTNLHRRPTKTGVTIWTAVVLAVGVGTLVAAVYALRAAIAQVSVAV